MDPATLLDALPLHLSSWRAELVVAVAALLALLVDQERPRTRWLVCLAGLAVALGLALPPWPADAMRALGPHLLIDPLSVAARLVVLLLALVTVAHWPAGRGSAAPFLLVAVLGLLVMVEAATLTALLLGCALAGLGAVLVRRSLGDRVAAVQGLVTLGFALAAFGGVFWCGLGGSVDLAAARGGLAARPLLPALAVPLVLGLLVLGLALACLAPLRRDGSRLQALWGPWFAGAPLLALVAVPSRLLLPMPQVPTLAAVPAVWLALGGLLAVGGFTAALGQTDPRQRLLAAAPGQLGLGWLGFAVIVPDDAPRAATAGLLLAVVAQAAALMLWARAAPGVARRAGLTVALLGLAAVPPLVVWRPRFAMLESLLADDQLVACGLVSLATLLGFVVYLQPLIALWRGVETVADGPDTNPAGQVLAWLLLGCAVAWGLGLVPAWQVAG
ncbi:MAG: hypothetical protein R3D98_01460 [Candidatus Krumholzibacteriia bacterium]